MSVLLLIFLFLALQYAAYYSEQQATELLKMQKLKLIFTYLSCNFCPKVKIGMFHGTNTCCIFGHFTLSILNVIHKEI